VDRYESRDEASVVGDVDRLAAFDSIEDVACAVAQFSESNRVIVVSRHAIDCITLR